MIDETTVVRGEPEVDDATRALVEKWTSRIREARSGYREDFRRMREDMQLARSGASQGWIEGGNYVVPIINRHINQAVAQIYAKNPKVVAKRRERLMSQLWDGSIVALEDATTRVAGGSGTPEDQTLLVEALKVREYRRFVDRVGKTQELLFDYFAGEQKPTQKRRMKKLVRRVKTCGVGYLEICFQREYKRDPGRTAQIEDHARRLGELQRRAQDLADEELQETDAEVAELETLIADLQAAVEADKVLLREGPVDQYPAATSVVPDPECCELEGFVGAGWVAREYYLTRAEVQARWNVDLGSDYAPYRRQGRGEEAEYLSEETVEDSAAGGRKSREKPGKVCVWRVQNKDLGQVFTIADGYSAFLEAPAAPAYEVEGFWTIFALTFNDSESEEHLFPLSDVHLLQHSQLEYNRSRQYRRLHREANKPKYFTQKGRLEEEDRKKLESHEPHSVIEISAITADMPIDRLIQGWQPIPLDPALYETRSEMEDVLRTVGVPEAAGFGGTSGDTATETSIAESARMTSVASNVDDLDGFLSAVARAKGQLMLMEMSADMVRSIVGPGAVWPEFDRQQIAKELYLDIQAGSSGRPNKAAELANLERALPYLIQLPGINPVPLAQRYADLLELDISDFVLEGMPSIQALNALFGRISAPTGNPETDPNAQGGQGAMNAPSTQENEPGAQPAMPGGGEAGIGQAIN